jgi:hypothetical protein
MSNIKPGDFNSLPLDSLSKEMLSDAYTVVTSLNLWDWLSNPTVPHNSFMFSNSTEVQQIIQTMKFTGHSGSSFGFTMRAMEFIAKKGWNSYVDNIIDSSTCPCRRAKGLCGGWCGVAGGGVPGCDH